MDLNGVWRALPATDALRRDATGPGVDDADWEPITVPGHWRNNAAFAQGDGPVLYRTDFQKAPPGESTRRWITFDGVFYQADVWLDGAYLGDPEGYFAPHSFDITALSRIEERHVLAVEVACPPQTDPRAKRNITGVFQSGFGIDPTWNPGGIWRPVRIHDTGPAHIDRLRVLCRDADQHRAHVLLTARIDLDEARKVSVLTRVDGELTATSDRQLAKGTNDVTWSIDIADPELWWPTGLGPQTLTTIDVEVIVDGKPSDRAVRRTGLREVAWKDWTFSINGERMFLRGVDLLPTRAGLGDATAAECALDVELAATLGCNMVRVLGHVARAETYETADQLGLVVMQDFPLMWGYQTSVRRSASHQAREMVDLLGHHPSVISWSAHNDPESIGVGLPEDLTQSATGFVVRHQVPGWNRTVLDRWVKRSIENADSTRSVSRSSGVLPHLPVVEGSDTHLYFGWYYGQMSDLERVAKSAPQVVRFVSEFGAQSMPTKPEFAAEAEWPALDWDRLVEHHGYHKRLFDTWVPPEEFATMDDWIAATQLYQAQLLRYQIELLRRLKYRPCGGYSFCYLNDPSPMVSFSVFDDQRRPKLAAAAIRSAQQPVLATASPLPMRATAGERINLALHIINDLRVDLAEATLEVSLTHDPDQAWNFGGTASADSTTQVGEASFVMPVGGTEVELTVRNAKETVSINRYRIIDVGS